MQEEHTRKGDLAHVISLRDKIVPHKREPAFMRPRLQTSKRYVFIFRNKCGPRSRFDVHPSPVVLSNVTGVYIFIYITFLFCFFFFGIFIVDFPSRQSRFSVEFNASVRRNTSRFAARLLRNELGIREYVRCS